MKTENLSRLDDYIRWVGALDFAACPFREADALVLCVISYFDLGPVFADERSPVYVRDCLKMLEAGEARLCITGGDMGNAAIFEAAARSERFGGLVMTDFDDIIRNEPAVQFSAVTFHDPRFSFVAYRGTDATLAGWKEDCMISFTQTEAQRMAVEYAERVIKAYDGDRAWYIGGHSKGGNQALYAACMLSPAAWERVAHVFLLDGPGLCPEVMDVGLIDRIDAKTTRIIPEFDVIGKLFEPKITDTRIVKSYREGVTQHSLASWLIDHGSLSHAEENDPHSVWFCETINDWIGTISQEARPSFVDELFAALGAGGADTLDDMGPEELQAALIGMVKSSAETKRTLASLPRRMIFEDALDTPKHEDIWTRLKTDHLIHSLLLIACGVFIFFASGSILDIAAMILVGSLALLQVVLTVRRLVKNHWKLEAMRERIILTIVLLALCAVIFIKEQAMFLMGSMIFGALFLVGAYSSSEKAAAERDDTFLRVLYIIEAGLAAVYGVSFLLIPQATVYAFAMSIGVTMVADGLIRLIVRLVRGGK